MQFILLTNEIPYQPEISNPGKCCCIFQGFKGGHACYCSSDTDYSTNRTNSDIRDSDEDNILKVAFLTANIEKLQRTTTQFVWLRKSY